VNPTRPKAALMAVMGRSAHGAVTDCIGASTQRN
jgi:hypothetical protein